MAIRAHANEINAPRGFKFRLRIISPAGLKFIVAIFKAQPGFKKVFLSPAGLIYIEN